MVSAIISNLAELSSGTLYAIQFTLLVLIVTFSLGLYLSLKNRW